MRSRSSLPLVLALLAGSTSAQQLETEVAKLVAADGAPQDKGGFSVSASGDIAVFGIDARRDPIAAKRVVAWVSDEPMVYDRLTPTEYLEFVAGLWQIDGRTAQAKANELIDWLGLRPHANELCGGFSKGMLQKVALAGALVHDPKLIILDEPLTGVRPRPGLQRGCCWRRSPSTRWTGASTESGLDGRNGPPLSMQG